MNLVIKISALLFIIQNCVGAQSPSAIPIQYATRKAIKQQQAGYVQVSTIYKSMTMDDASNYVGHLYYWRTQYDSLGRCPFVLDIEDGELVVFNSKTLYIFRDKTKEYTKYTDPIQTHQRIGGQVMTDVLLHEYYTTLKSEPIDSSVFNKAILGTLGKNDEEFITVDLDIKFEQVQKPTPDFLDSLVYQRHFKYKLPELLLAEDKVLIYATEIPQISHTTFSNHRKLSELETFENISKLDSLLKAYKHTRNNGLREDTIVLIEKGSTISLPDFVDVNDQKVEIDRPYLLIDLWYSSCFPCMLAIPTLHKIEKEFGDKVQLIGINPVDKDIEKIKRYATKKEVHYPLIQDPGKKLATEWGVQGYPAFILIDTNTMEVLFSSSGFNPEKSPEQFIKMIKALP